MTTFWRLTDAAGDIHLFNVNHLCCCDLEHRTDDLYLCTLTFRDNVSSIFYVGHNTATRLMTCLGKVEAL